MKILPRITGLWYDAEFDTQSRRYKVNREGNPWYLDASDLFAVKETDEEAATNYLICSRCNTVIPNTEEAVRDHKKVDMEFDVSECPKCRYYRKYVASHTTLQTERREGVLYETEENKMMERCMYTYPYTTITADFRKEDCTKFHCQRAAFAHYPVFFKENPDVFDEIPVVTALSPNKWKQDNTWLHTRKCRYRINAIINDKKMIQCFVVNFRNRGAKVVYSVRQKKWYRINADKYVPELPCFVTERPAYVRELDKIVKEIWGDEAL